MQSRSGGQGPKRVLSKKDRVAAIEAMREHLIIRAPMGTVFRLSGEQWQALAEVLPDSPPSPTSSTEQSGPRPFAWGQRRKSTFPLPGGYGTFLDSL